MGLGVGILVGGVVVGSGGVTIVVGMVVTCDGWGRDGLGVIVGVAGVGTAPGGETVPVTGGGEGIAMLTAGGGETGAPLVTGAVVVAVPGAIVGVEGVAAGAEDAGMNPPETVTVVGCVVTAGEAVACGPAGPVPGAPADSLPVGDG